jgi:hypothetical protein
MSRRWPLRSALVALFAAILMMSCDSATGPEPTVTSESSDLLGIGRILRPIIEPPPPAEEEEERDRPVDPDDEEDPADGEDDGEGDEPDERGLTFIVESGPGRPQVVTGLFGVLGGLLNVDGHGLAVPRGAVLRLTLFSMATVAGPVIDVDLNAYENNLLNRILTRVGLFNRPVTVELSYAQATNVTDPSRLVIVRVHDDGTFEVLPTRVDRNRRVVTAELDHFSKYAMASN